MAGNLIKYPLGANMGFGFSTSCGGGGSGGGGGGTATTFNIYNEANSVPAGSVTNIVQFAIPPTNHVMLYRVDFSGSNIGHYQLYFDANVKMSAWTWFNGPMFSFWDFSTSPYGGLIIEGGTVMTLKVSHNRPFIGDYSGRFLGIIY